jgi:oxalate decarboxylase/phosphoglucose isomerase-like protein (cupin superfamily)
MAQTVTFSDITPSFRKDGRGWHMSPLVPGFPALGPGCHLHIVSLLPGAIRGNHSHTTTDEWMVFWGGRVLFAWQEKGKPREKLLEEDKAYLVHVPAGEPHACRNTGEKESYLLSYYEKAIKDYDRETVKKVLMEQSS